jgi:hypothetical protein
MTPLEVARVAQLLAILAGGILATRRRAYIAPALYLGAVGLLSWARAALAAVELAPARAALRARGLDPALVPFTEPRTLLAVHLDGAAQLGGHALLGALAALVFSTRPRRALLAIAGAWGACSGLLAAGYPMTRGSVRAVAYTAAGLAAVGLDLRARGQRLEVLLGEILSTLRQPTTPPPTPGDRPARLPPPPAPPLRGYFGDERPSPTPTSTPAPRPPRRR